MNYFELYPGDYLKATGRLTLVDHGAYLRLLLEYYATEEPLPADLAELYVIAAATTAAEKAAVRKVAERFFPVSPDDGLRHNGRVDEEIEKARARMAAARENGKRGGRPKKNPVGSEEKPSGFPLGSIPVAENETQKKALQTPRAIHPPEGLQRADTSLGARAQGHAEPEPVRDTPTAAGRACLAMRRGGIAQTNPSHPALLAAIAEGATDAMWEHTAREAVGHSPPKGFAWVIATVRGRLADVANKNASTTGASHAADHAGNRRLSAVERIEANIRSARQRGEDFVDDSNAIPGTAVRIAR